MNSFEIPSATDAKSISLFHLLEELLGCYERVKRDHRHFFINEVPRNLSVAAGKNMLAPVLGDLFAIISSNPGNNCVRISAKKSDKGVTLLIKKSVINGFSFSGIRVNAA